MGFIGPIEMDDRRPFFGEESHKNPPEKFMQFFLPVLDCTKPEMRNIWADPGPTLGSWRP